MIVSTTMSPWSQESLDRPFSPDRLPENAGTRTPPGAAGRLAKTRRSRQSPDHERLFTQNFLANPMTGALEGILVIAVEQAVAAPYCSVRLADAGARVIKIERAEGDFARHY